MTTVEISPPDERHPAFSEQDLGAALIDDALRSHYQPIVDLHTGETVGYEALARWPEIPGADPLSVFAAAHRLGRTAELDWACRVAALRGALDAKLGRRKALFVNVEAAALGGAPPPGTMPVVERAMRELRVVVELTERSLLSQPAHLQRLVQWAREHGCAIALDDVGADPDSLALLPIVKPDVIKLDLNLVQRSPSSDQSRTCAIVRAHAERHGTAILAEGIETRAHLEQAISLGARYGQGWLYGRPGPLPSQPRSSRLPVRSWITVDGS